jgi:hypothetical protein
MFICVAPHPGEHKDDQVIVSAGQRSPIQTEQEDAKGTHLVWRRNGPKLIKEMGVSTMENSRRKPWIVKGLNTQTTVWTSLS